VIEQRKVEDTWQIDTFESVSAAPIRPPDEVSINSSSERFLYLCCQAIVLCLDLSQSMSQRSGVSDRNAGRSNDFDPEAASWELLGDLAKDVSASDILRAGETCSESSDEISHSFST
jgi:hypothetical protein